MPGHEASENRVIRGGSFENTARNARSAYRNRNDAGNRWHNVGFRPALSNPSHREIGAVLHRAAVHATASPGIRAGALASAESCRARQWS